MGVDLIGIHLLSVDLMGVDFIGVHLIGVHPIGVHPMGRRASYGHISLPGLSRRRPHLAVVGRRRQGHRVLPPLLVQGSAWR